MKKCLRLLFTMMLLSVVGIGTVNAVPAKRGAVKVQQPDGSYVSIVLHGDEWMHFNTTEDGYTVVKNDKGFYVYAEKQAGQLIATAMVAHDAAQRQASEQTFLASMQKYQTPEMSAEAARMKQDMAQHIANKQAARRAAGKNRAAQYNYNNFRGLVILIEYSDKQFSRSDYKDIVNDMLNKENYTGFDNQIYTGSVRDYFSDNSLGKFQPQFDVYGPYQVDNSQYSALQTAGARDIINKVLNMADSDINFKNYDGDNDGVVDMIYFIVAGNGSNYGGNDDRLWWPHASAVISNTNSYVVKDGVRLWDYASSVELTGYTYYPSTVKIDGIGTICHEFSHVLGLPDFYDTNYGINGQSNDPGIWSVMAGGSYENDSRTPVGFSLYERWAMGFCDEEPEVLSIGDYTLPALHIAQKGYRINTPTNGEYFLLENRQKTAFKWDAYLPGSGMLVHRVEGEGNYYWQSNMVNAYANHNYYEVVRANGAHTLSGGYVPSADDVFPSKGVTQLTNNTSPANLKTWAGVGNKLGLSNITQSNGVISFIVAGYDVVALNITPIEIVELGVGITQQLNVEVIPVYAETDITWTSSNPNIATVDAQGVVKGVSAGTAIITATSTNGVKATCNVTVKELEVYTVADFKKQTIGTTQLLKLQDAEVLGVYQNTAYLRDASGCIMLSNMDLGLKRNDIVNGMLMAAVGVDNKMPQAVGTSNTNASGLTIVEGGEVQPREIRVNDLTEADYCDYVLVKQGKLKSDGGVWLVNENGEKVARLYNKLQISGISLKNYDGNYYDIPAIYGTDVLNGEVINELYMIKTPTKVDAPTGIENITIGQPYGNNSQYYNLNGQRVGSGYKGLTIVNGRKVLKK